MNEVSRNRNAVFYTILDGAMSTAVLLITMFVVTNYLEGELQWYYFLILFLAAAAQKVVQALLRREKKKKKVVRLLISAGIYLLSAIICFFSDGSIEVTKYLVFFLFVDLIIGRVIMVIGCKKWRSRILNILIGLFWAYFAVYCILVDRVEDISALVLLLLGYICLQCLLHIIVMSFSQIKLDILMKIIRKTYALEILFGLGMLIISFSYVLQYFDRNTFHSFGDGLWYCFAVVTTTGFGDIAAASPAGRILSVILGIYGIIVVSLITSIIVNFYTEVKNEKEETDDQQDNEEQKIDAEIRELQQKLELLTEKKKQLPKGTVEHGSGNSEGEVTPGDEK
ncbi:MAG: hypothetical protein IKN79_08165 [Eubacterium sp.]|nr:hypothetical protein [Eubacterium sp.]